MSRDYRSSKDTTRQPSFDNTSYSFMLNPPSHGSSKLRFSLKGFYHLTPVPQRTSDEAMASEVLANAYRGHSHTYTSLLGSKPLKNKLDLSLTLLGRPASFPLPSPPPPHPPSSDSLGKAREELWRMKGRQPSPVAVVTPVNQIYSFLPFCDQQPPSLPSPEIHSHCSPHLPQAPHFALPSSPPAVKPFAHKASLRQNRTLASRDCCVCSEPLSSAFLEHLERIIEMKCGDSAHEDCFTEFLRFNRSAPTSHDGVASLPQTLFGTCPGMCSHMGVTQPCIPANPTVAHKLLSEALLRAPAPPMGLERGGAFTQSTQGTGALAERSVAYKRNVTQPNRLSVRSANGGGYMSPSGNSSPGLVRQVPLVYLLPRGEPFSPHQRGSSLSGRASVISSASPIKPTHTIEQRSSAVTYTRPLSLQPSLYARLPLVSVKARFIQTFLNNAGPLFGELRLADRFLASLDLEGEYLLFTVLLFASGIVLVDSAMVTQPIALPPTARISFPLANTLKIDTSQGIRLYLRPQSGGDGNGLLEKWVISFLDPKFVFPLELFTSTVDLDGVVKEAIVPSESLPIAAKAPTEVIIILHSVDFGGDDITTFQNILRGFLILKVGVRVLVCHADGHSTFTRCALLDLDFIGERCRQPAGPLTPKAMMEVDRYTATTLSDAVRVVVLSTNKYDGPLITKGLMLQVGGKGSLVFSWDSVMEVLVTELGMDSMFDASYLGESDEDEAEIEDLGPIFNQPLTSSSLEESSSEDDSDSDQELINDLVERLLPPRNGARAKATDHESQKDNGSMRYVGDTEITSSPSPPRPDPALVPESLAVSPVSLASLSCFVGEFREKSESPLQIRWNAKSLTGPRPLAVREKMSPKQPYSAPAANWMSLFTDIDRALDETKRRVPVGAMDFDISCLGNAP